MPALAPTTLALTLISAVNSDYSAGAFTNPSFGFGKKPLTPVAPEDPPAATNVFKPAHSPAFCAALKQLSSPPRRFSPFTGAYQTDNPMHLVYGPISEWDTSRVTDMSRAFAHASFFNAGELRARVRERQRDGETERQIDRETERQRDRETERQSDRETEARGSSLACCHFPIHPSTHLPCSRRYTTLRAALLQTSRAGTPPRSHRSMVCSREQRPSILVSGRARCIARSTTHTAYYVDVY